MYDVDELRPGAVTGRFDGQPQRAPRTAWQNDNEPPAVVREAAATIAQALARSPYGDLDYRSAAPHVTPGWWIDG